MNEKLKRLKELAGKATPGEWLRDQYPDVNSQVIARGNEVILWHRGHGRQHNERVIPNMEYIAAANPETIKALIAELEAKEAEVEALKKLLGRIVSNPRWCSIGAINNVAEIRISKEDYEQVLEGIKTGDA